MCICISNLKRECTGRDGNVLSVRVKNTCCLRNRIQYATNCISYGLLRAPHSRNPTGIRTSVPLARHFVLIPVAFESAYSLLHTLRA